VSPIGAVQWRCYRCSKGQKFCEPVPLDRIDVVHVFIQALDRYDNPQPGESVKFSRRYTSPTYTNTLLYSLTNLETAAQLAARDVQNLVVGKPHLNSTHPEPEDTRKTTLARSKEIVLRT
jgi:hypothetical protein